MNKCHASGAKGFGTCKPFGAALLTAVLLALPESGLMAVSDEGNGSELDPWIFNSTNYTLFQDSYHTSAGYMFNGSGYCVTGSSVDVSGQSYPYIVVGYSTTGNILTICNGYTVTDLDGYIGYNSGSGGTMIVTGSGSKWANTNKLYVGYNGTGELDVKDNGTVTAPDMYVGNTGTGTLNIYSGTVSITNCFVGHASGGSGTVTVTGSSSTLSATSQLIIGNVNTGTLNVKDGGTVTNESGVLGNNTGVTGTALVTGAGSTWTNGSLLVGYVGSGILNIEDGGSVINAGTIIGYDAGTSGTATVTGTNSKLTNSSILCVGFNGTGVLNIEDGGSASTDYGYIGGYSVSGTTGDGTVTVTGEGSTLKSTNILYVGYNSKGVLNVESGGSVSAENVCYIGFMAGSNGKVTVTGSDSSGNASTMTVKGGISVGNEGSGELNILNGGRFISQYDSIIGYVNTGTVLVSGSGSELVVSGTLNVGADSDNSSGKLTIEDGGLVTAAGISLTSGYGTLYIGGGYLALADDQTSAINALLDGGTTVYAWNGTQYELVNSSNETSLVSVTYYSDISSCSSLSSYALSGSYTVLTSLSSVPEPATYAFIGGLGALGLALFRRGKRSQARGEK